MTRRTGRALCLLGALASAPAFAFDTSRIHDPAVRACVERALPTATARQVQQLTAVGKDGYERQSVREMLWKRSPDNDSRVLLRVLEPRDERGVAVLVNDDAERNVVSYMAYSPRIKRVRRVTGESVFGTIITSDFTYDDFSYFYRVDEREQVERMEDGDVDGEPAYVLESRKSREDGEYSRVRFYIDMQICLPMRTEFHGPNGELRKELVADRARVEQVGTHFVPYLTTMIDHKLGTRSIYEVLEVEIDPPFDDALFETAALTRGGN